MRDDPIVEEVHRIRKKLLAECDGDLDRYMDRLRHSESELRGRVVESIEELKAATAGRRKTPTRPAWIRPAWTP